MSLRAKITGTGMCVPERRVTNKDLEARMDTSDEWIRQRTGIVERRHVSEGETPADLAEAASRQALARAGLEADQVDCIIVPTLSSQHEFPGTSFFLQERLGGHVPCFDLRAQCSGFLYGLSVAKAMVVSGEYRRVLLVGTEVHSTGLDFSDEGRDVAVLFGDGAGAVVVEANEDPNDPAGILGVRLHAEGKYAKKLWVESPGSGIYPERLNAELVARGAHFPKMQGRYVFKHAVTRMPEVLGEALEASGVKQDDVDLFLFHQANLRINEFVANALEIPESKLRNNIQRYGNCSAASIPILLSEASDEGLLAPGRLVSMTGFGSGFSWASAVVRW
jgi:3-oxoacyl-[acyl-carrier-protein] synthase-3